MLYTIHLPTGGFRACKMLNIEKEDVHHSYTFAKNSTSKSIL